MFSKRSDEIAEHLAATGRHGYRARSVAARATRSVKRHTGADELLPVWQAELDAAGWPLERLTEHLAAARPRRLPFPLTAAEIDAIGAEVFDVDGRLLARHKVFTRTHLVAEVAPRLYGRDPVELDRVLDRILASRDIVPLIGVAAAREQSYTTVEVLAAEQTIARTIEALADRPGPHVQPGCVEAAIRRQAATDRPAAHRRSTRRRRTRRHVRAGSVDRRRCRRLGQDHRIGCRHVSAGSVRVSGARHVDERSGDPHPRHRGRDRGAHVGVAALATRPP